MTHQKCCEYWQLTNMALIYQLRVEQHSYNFLNFIKKTGKYTAPIKHFNHIEINKYIT